MPAETIRIGRNPPPNTVIASNKNVSVTLEFDAAGSKESWGTAALPTLNFKLDAADSNALRGIIAASKSSFTVTWGPGEQGTLSGVSIT